MVPIMVHCSSGQFARGVVCGCGLQPKLACTYMFSRVCVCGGGGLIVSAPPWTPVPVEVEGYGCICVATWPCVAVCSMSGGSEGCPCGLMEFGWGEGGRIIR